METQIDYWDAHALLEWQVELGISEAICETPVNRFEVPEKVTKPPVAVNTPKGKPPMPAKAAPEVDSIDVAHKAVSGVTSLDALQAALNGFELCDLHRGARNSVFAGGVVGAKVMVIDDVPSRDEDIAGVPFAGAAGVLFDQMFDAIGLSRSAHEANKGVYLSAVLPWRAPENRDPSSQELAMMTPFLLKHIELANPDIIVMMGNHPCAALLGRTGVTRLRGKWQTIAGKPALPMVHPRALLRTPIAKREAWADLLALKARLRGTH
jgi:DNA polymerase